MAPHPQHTLDELKSTWQRLEINPAALTVESDGTISSSTSAASLPTDAPLPALQGPHSIHEVDLRELLGEGGMGLVFLGAQRSLKREVAVKVARPGVSESVAASLLREARVTGALQHPGIVPVHMVGVGEDGRAMVVMKRLPGQIWSKRLRDEPPATAAALDRELAILEHVANALAFAHERGILHRDIKPDNVMLGDFGEVYLVDWGLAARMPDSQIVEAPLAADVRQIAGTLYYMAPEMAAGEGTGLGRHTDVYLLGATLYELLTGRPPHMPDDDADSSPQAVLFQIFCGSAPELPASVPDALGALCKRSLPREPDARFADAGAFRDALRAYRADRLSQELASDARRRLADADAAERARTSSSAEGEDPQVDTWLAQARFGFEQALRNDPDNPRLRDELNETIIRIVDREIAQHRLVAAELLMREVTRANAVIEARLRALRESLEEAKARAAALEKAAAESDLGRGARIRKRRGVAFGLAFLALHVALGVLARAAHWTLSVVHYLAVTSALASLFAIPAMVQHRVVYPNLANRRFALTLGIMLVGQVLIFVGAEACGVEVQQALALSLVQLGTVVAVKTQLLDRRVFWTSFVIFGLALAGFLWPTWILEWVGLAYATYFLGGALLSFETTGDGRPGDHVLQHLGQFTQRPRQPGLFGPRAPSEPPSSTRADAAGTEGRDNEP